MIPRFVIPLVALAALVAPALAQQPGQPPRPPQPQHEYRAAPGQPGQPGQPGRDVHVDPRFVDVPQQIRVVQGYLGLVGQLNTLAQDPAASGIAAVLGASEILKPRGADAVIEYFTKLLPEVKNEAVRRAIRLQLVDAYKTSNQHDKALSELQTLITGTPVTAKPE